MAAPIKFRSRRTPATPVAVVGAAYGLTVSIRAPDPATLAQLRAALPPGWVEGASAEIELRFAVTTEDRQTYVLTLNDGPLLDEASLEQILDVLPGLVRRYVAGTAPEAVFVHAGAVAYKGQGIVIPGKSFSGKTTLVAALVRAGAAYYSDEYAVITPDGYLIPYSQDLSLRLTAGEAQQTATAVSEIGGSAGSDPVKIRLLVLTEYRSSAVWAPSQISAAQGLVEILGHAEPVQDRPAETVRAVRNALEGATVLRGRRGDADQTATALLALLD